MSLVATTWVACKQILNLKTRASFQQISNAMRDQDYRFMFVAFIVLHDRGKLTLCVNQQHTATASSSEPPARPEHGTRCDSVGGKPGTSSTVKSYVLGGQRISPRTFQCGCCRSDSETLLRACLGGPAHSAAGVQLSGSGAHCVRLLVSPTHNTTKTSNSHMQARAWAAAGEGCTVQLAPAAVDVMRILAKAQSAESCNASRVPEGAV